jgi:hypothetical protein
MAQNPSTTRTGGYNLSRRWLDPFPVDSEKHHKIKLHEILSSEDRAVLVKCSINDELYAVKMVGFCHHPQVFFIWPFCPYPR